VPVSFNVSVIECHRLLKGNIYHDVLRMYIPKRTLYTPKRALHTLKRALYKRGLHTYKSMKDRPKRACLSLSSAYLKSSRYPGGMCQGMPSVIQDATQHITLRLLNTVITIITVAPLQYILLVYSDKNTLMSMFRSNICRVLLFRALLSIRRALLGVYRALVCRSFLRVWRALLSVYWTKEYKNLLDFFVQGSLSVCKGTKHLLSVCKAPLQVYRALVYRTFWRVVDVSWLYIGLFYVGSFECLFASEVSVTGEGKS